MRAAIAEAHDRIGIVDHLAAGIEIEMRVIGKGREEEGPALVFEAACHRQARRDRCLGAPPCWRSIFHAGAHSRAACRAETCAQSHHSPRSGRALARFRLRKHARAEGRITHGGETLVERLCGDGAIGMRRGEGIGACLQAIKDADGARRDLRTHREPVIRGIEMRPRSERQPSGRPCAWRAKARGPPGFFDKAADHREFGLLVGLVEIGNEFHDAAASIAQALGDAHEFGFGGAERRRAGRPSPSCG